MPLVDLPVEIIHEIVRQLDPASLITFSQTSKLFRAIIEPSRHEFERRLLYLELLPEYGGIIPVYCFQNNSTVSPAYDSPAWKTNRYACCGCMRLLPHAMFDNSNISRMRLRKPSPGSVEYERSMVTDWMPVPPAARWKVYQERANKARREDEKWRHLITDAYRLEAELNAVQTGDGARFEHSSHTQVEIAESEAEKHLCGSQRRRRRCIECLFQRGHYKRLNPFFSEWHFDPQQPGIASRPVRLTYIWERCYPGLFDFDPLPAKDRPRLFSWPLPYGPSLFQWCHYVIRCHECGVWQEQGAFRYWFTDSFIQEAQRDWDTNWPWSCDTCEMKKIGPKKLAERLTQAALINMKEDLNWIFHMLTFGWGMLYQDFYGEHNEPAPLRQWQAIGNEILGGLSWTKARDGYPYQYSISCTADDLPDLRRRFRLFRDFLYRPDVYQRVRHSILQSWFQLWVEDYDKYEKVYYWLRDKMEWLKTEETRMLSYMLERQPYRIASGPAASW
ncbi:uncharacterized protein CTHT_0040190 [Thermochaetoides thermophila DSM 1495]|uniref:F-box domain-containing protein n=1 Tax=Chaetomium thermophilum (strain DSM 1495 / CBS 144.50 / IMI 039719) TaxID=759272 RepID=G0S8S7_CHATD|nr:hypothetical protein CTHT_0040190 [Thermochaetoides thermophila DSM 1495]EGS20280.1 hypothetical protein CTHT_0040190 [Thermochaetoides thermophila DSM 1495]